MAQRLIKSQKYGLRLLNFFNSLGAKALTKYGINEAIKKMCGVEECNAFYWERPEYANRT
jgi:hypothetical protein